MEDKVLVNENVRLAGEVRRLRIENAKLVLALSEIEEDAAGSDPARPVLPGIFRKIQSTFESLTKKD